MSKQIFELASSLGDPVSMLEMTRFENIVLEKKNHELRFEVEKLQAKLLQAEDDLKSLQAVLDTTNAILTKLLEERQY